MKPNRIEAALATMIAMIESGKEYPDAHTQAGEKHALVGRQYALLTEAYDVYCEQSRYYDDRQLATDYAT